MKRKAAKSSGVAGDPVRVFLRERGCPAAVVEGGIEGLIAQWETFARALTKTYAHGIEDLLNDLDARQLIAEVWPLAPAADSARLAERLAAADARVQAATTPTEVCLWGSKVERRERYSATANWWFFVVPKKATAALRTAVDAVG